MTLIARNLYTVLIQFLPLLLSFLLLPACNGNNDKNSSVGSCIQCHDVQLDDAHAFSCSRCHGGNEKEEAKELAHAGLVFTPAHPEQAEASCAPCHPEQVSGSLKNAHYQLPSYTAMIASGKEEIVHPGQIRSFAAPSSGTELLQDMLKRKCMRCHVYHQGDQFPLTRRATGCGACHLEYYNSTMLSHIFLKRPKDTACLSCHYGNRVGFDYYGYFEHDLNEEYRTPYTTREAFFRPYGVEYHNLEPDIHQRAGLVCIDCHSQNQLMGNGTEKADCRACHDLKFLGNGFPGTKKDEKGRFIYLSAATGKTFLLPVMNHPAHVEFQDRFSCQACHAQWSFQDRQTHLLRIDHDYLDEFDRLTLDGDSHAHQLIFSNLDFDSETLETLTKDYFTGESFPGIWVQGYLERRWEPVTLAADEDGTIHVSRPILDLYLSWIDAEETTRFDNFRPYSPADAKRPYIPHTIGHAGAFFRQKLSPFIPDREEVPAGTPAQNN